MNYNYYKMLQKKEWRRNFIFIFIVLVFATISTYLIYNEFKSVRDYKMRLPNISVTYHEGDTIEVPKYVAVTDAVGLSTNPYNITVKNNTNKKVYFSIKLSDYKKKNKKYKDSTFLPRSALKVSVHEKGEQTDIYNMDDIDDELVSKTLKPKEESDYKIRVWGTKSSLDDDDNYYYIGKLKVIGED